MPSTVQDLIGGISTSVAVKAPVYTVALVALTLSGEQTVNGFAVTDGKRVLVPEQTDATTNGIYYCRTGIWQRCEDFDGARDVVAGTLIPVLNVGGGYPFYQVATADPITIGTSDINFDPAPLLTGRLGPLFMADDYIHGNDASDSDAINRAANLANLVGGSVGLATRTYTLKKDGTHAWCCNFQSTTNVRFYLFGAVLKLHSSLVGTTCAIVNANRSTGFHMHGGRMDGSWDGTGATGNNSENTGILLRSAANATIEGVVQHDIHGDLVYIGKDTTDFATTTTSGFVMADPGFTQSFDVTATTNLVVGSQVKVTDHVNALHGNVTNIAGLTITVFTVSIFGTSGATLASGSDMTWSSYLAASSNIKVRDLMWYATNGNGYICSRNGVGLQQEATNVEISGIACQDGSVLYSEAVDAELEGIPNPANNVVIARNTFKVRNQANARSIALSGEQVTNTVIEDNVVDAPIQINDARIFSVARNRIDITGLITYPGIFVQGFQGEISGWIKDNIVNHAGANPVGGVGGSQDGAIQLCQYSGMGAPEGIEVCGNKVYAAGTRSAFLLNGCASLCSVHDNRWQGNNLAPTAYWANTMPVDHLEYHGNEHYRGTIGVQIVYNATKHFRWQVSKNRFAPLSFNMFSVATISTFTLRDDQTALFGNAQAFTVTDAAGNNGAYTAAIASTYNANLRLTTVTVTGALLGLTFTVSGITVTPTAGATYTTAGNTYTVTAASIALGVGIVTMTQTPGTAFIPGATGTLTKTGGTGDASIAYSAVTSSLKGQAVLPETMTYGYDSSNSSPVSGTPPYMGEDIFAGSIIPYRFASGFFARTRGPHVGTPAASTNGAGVQIGYPASRFLVFGSPEAVITAPLGSKADRLDGSGSTLEYVKTTATGNTGWAPCVDAYLVGTATWNPASLASGASQNTTVTVTGAALGNNVISVSFSLDTAGSTLVGAVTSANTVTVTQSNLTGGAVDLASGTLTVRVAQ